MSQSIPRSLPFFSHLRRGARPSGLAMSHVQSQLNITELGSHEISLLQVFLAAWSRVSCQSMQITILEVSTCTTWDTNLGWGKWRRGLRPSASADGASGEGSGSGLPRMCGARPWTVVGQLRYRPSCHTFWGRTDQKKNWSACWSHGLPYLEPKLRGTRHRQFHALIPLSFAWSSKRQWTSCSTSKLQGIRILRQRPHTRVASQLENGL